MNASDMAHIIAQVMEEQWGYHARKVTETTVEVCVGEWDDSESVTFKVEVQ